MVLGPVDFVGDDQDRNLGPAQRLRQLGVAGAQPSAPVDDEAGRPLEHQEHLLLAVMAMEGTLDLAGRQNGFCAFPDT